MRECPLSNSFEGSNPGDTLGRVVEDGFDTPEDAARGDIPSRFVRVVGVVVRGDEVIVAQLVNDRPPYEVETAHCWRERSGWTGGASGNSTSAWIATGETACTFVLWDEAPVSAVAARFEYAGSEQVVPVENGCALAVFDEVTKEDALLHKPRLAAWIDAHGSEEPLARHELPEWLQQKLLGQLDDVALLEDQGITAFFDDEGIIERSE